MRKIMTGVLFLITPFLLLGLPGTGQALTLYDDFSSKPLNPDKWMGRERDFGPGAPNTETTRKIKQGAAGIDLTTYGFTSSDSGTSGISSSNLSVIDPAAVTTMQADVTVKNAKVVGCAANPTGSAARARLIGEFFNDGSSTGVGDRTGDIVAAMHSQLDSLAGDSLVAFLARCTNATCTTTSVLTSHVFTAVWAKGVADTFLMQWDQPNHQFHFTLNPGGSQEQATLGYTQSDSTAPGFGFKALQAANTIASCQSGPRGSATMKALFDNVMVNP